MSSILSLGIGLIEVNGTIPLGPALRDSYYFGDVDEARTNSPELDFGIVHGGLVFAEETARQTAKERRREHQQTLADRYAEERSAVPASPAED